MAQERRIASYPEASLTVHFIYQCTAYAWCLEDIESIDDVRNLKALEGFSRTVTFDRYNRGVSQRALSDCNQ